MSKGDRSDFKDLVEALNGFYSGNSGFQYKNLSLPWSWPEEWNIAKKKELATRGEKEHYEIAKRFVARFPEIFANRSYWNRYFKFVTTDKRRTAQSAMAFALGLFEDKGPLGNLKVQPVALEFSGAEDSDVVLLPADVCPRFQQEIIEGGGMQQYEDFKTGTEVGKVTQKLREKLKVSGKVEIAATVMFELCAFAFLLEQDLGWCSLFDKDDADVMQYLNDLEAYYESSYGHELSYEIICPLVNEIVSTIKVFKEERETFGIFRFAHSETLRPLFTMLGLFNESIPLRADNFEKQAGRQFSTSHNTPLASNAAFVLYECSGKEFKVQFMINEAPVGLPCCYGNSTCSLTKFLSCYEPIGKRCDFDAMCQLPQSTTPCAGATPAPATRGSAVRHAQFRAWILMLAMLAVLGAMRRQ